MTKYANIPTGFERVPVQYGGLSKRPRKVHCIALIGSMPTHGAVESYYRIADGESGAGRFYVVRRWKDIRNDYTWMSHYYLSYRELPEAVRKHIESGAKGTYYDRTPSESILERRKEDR